MGIEIGLQFKDQAFGMTMIVIGTDGDDVLANSQIELDFAFILDETDPVPVYRYPQSQFYPLKEAS